MLTDQIRSTVESSMCATDLPVSAEVADTSQDQPQTYALSSCPSETDSTFPTGQQVPLLDLQSSNPNKHCVTATVHSVGITDNDEENDASDNEIQQYFPALS